MSYLTKIARNALLKNKTFRASSYVPGVSDERISKWVSSLNTRAQSAEAKGYVTQLSSIVNYFNRKADSNIPNIDWN